MLIARYLVIWLSFAILFFLLIHVATTPIRRQRAFNGQTVKASFFLVMAGTLAALVMAFIIAAEKYI